MMRTDKQQLVIEQLRRERAGADREAERLRRQLAYADASADFYLAEIERRCGDRAASEAVAAWAKEWSTERVAAHHSQHYVRHPEARLDVNAGLAVCIRCHPTVDALMRRRMREVMSNSAGD